MRKIPVGRKIGLARTLSKLGYCSRSRASQLIRAGRVRLNGTIRRDPEFPAGGKNINLAVDDKPLTAPAKIYLMLNKPRGVVTTASDEQGRPTVYGLLGERFKDAGGDQPVDSLPWVAPVGRLDKASEGLLLLTNDSHWAARIAAPETHLDKTYHVQIGIVADEKFVRSLVKGVNNGEEVLRAKRASLLRAGEKTCWLELVLDEGKNRQIRRMIEGKGVEVLRLVRVAIGPLQLGDLPKGQHRFLTSDEKRLLDAAMKEKD